MLVLANPGPPGKWPLKREREYICRFQNLFFWYTIIAGGCVCHFRRILRRAAASGCLDWACTRRSATCARCSNITARSTRFRSSTTTSPADREDSRSCTWEPTKMQWRWVVSAYLIASLLHYRCHRWLCRQVPVGLMKDLGDAEQGCLLQSGCCRCLTTSRVEIQKHIICLTVEILSDKWQHSWFCTIRTASY